MRVVFFTVAGRGADTLLPLFPAPGTAWMCHCVEFKQNGAFAAYTNGNIFKHFGFGQNVNIYRVL